MTGHGTLIVKKTQLPGVGSIRNPNLPTIRPQTQNVPLSRPQAQRYLLNRVAFLDHCFDLGRIDAGWAWRRDIDV